MSHSTRTLAFVSLKGGVAKTTNTANIAGELARRGNDVLAIDLDPRGGLTTSLGMREAPDPDQWLHQLLTSRTLGEGERAMVHAPQPSCGERLWVMPSSGEDLKEADFQLTSRPAGNIQLRKVLRNLNHDWDWVVIDTPPDLGTLTFSAMMAATDIVICLDASVLAYDQVEEAISTIALARELRPTDPPNLLGALIARVFERRKATRDVIAWLETDRIPRIPTLIPLLQDIEDAPAAGVPIVLSSPDHRASFRYREVVDWLESANVPAQAAA